jgi:predicted  nucleic acid-binding Zn-ribbon protein
MMQQAEVSRRGAEGAEKKKETGAKPPSPLATCHSPPDSAPKLDKKELRKQRAQAREALYSRTKDFKTAIHKAEKEVEHLEAEKAKLTEQLSAPPETINFAALSRRLQQVQYEIDIATGKWEQATEALERVMGESGGE